MLVLTHWLVITNFFPVNGISEVVDLSRHDWKFKSKGPGRPKIDHEIRVKVDKELDDLFSEESELF